MVERLLRLKAQLTDGALRRFRKTCAEVAENELVRAVETVAQKVGPSPHLNFNAFVAEVEEAAGELGIRMDDQGTAGIMPDNGQVERMNRTIKEATVKRFHYGSHEQLQVHLADFLDAYNFARRLETLRGLTPFGAFCKAWTDEPHRFKVNPLHRFPGPNI